MTGGPDPAPGARPPSPWALYLTVFLIATAGLVYELVAGAVASYVLGDSVTQFSLVIGLYLSALGLGAYFSKFVEHNVALRFVDVELATALIGGVSAPLLLFAFAHGTSFHLVLWGVVLATGSLVGLELPLLMRLLRDQIAFKDLIATALLFDYLGALAASMLFALLLVPTLGLVRTSLLFGLLNALVGLGSTWLLGEDSRAMRAARVRAVVVAAFLLLLFSQAERLTRAAEVALYPDPILFAQQSTYQRIIVTRGRGGFSLFLNNNLQFASADEHRYHEALVHPALAAASSPPRRVLIAGGGDGLAAREALRYPDIERITLVDLDPAITRASASVDPLSAQNQGALADPRVTVINDDAMAFLARSPDRFDALIVDFPDPNNLALGKLFTTRFYAIARDHLAPGGAMVVQSTSPYYSRQSFWCIARTIEASGLHAHPYHAFVPSFGEWGFVLARAEPFDPPSRLRLQGLSFLDGPQLAALFRFPADIARVEGPVNRLDNQALVRLYEHEIGRYAAFLGLRGVALGGGTWWPRGLLGSGCEGSRSVGGTWGPRGLDERGLRALALCGQGDAGGASPPCCPPDNPHRPPENNSTCRCRGAAGRSGERTNALRAPPLRGGTHLRALDDAEMGEGRWERGDGRWEMGDADIGVVASAPAVRASARMPAMAPRFWLLSLLLLGCTKTNKVEIDAPAEQPSTCLTACQWAAKTGTDEASPWCGLPVPTGGTKGSDLTACQKDCASQATAQSVLTCTDSARTCEEIRACGLLQKK